MTNDELREWAEGIIHSDPDGAGHLRVEVAPAVLRLLFEGRGSWRPGRVVIASAPVGTPEAAKLYEQAQAMGGIDFVVVKESSGD